MAFPPTDITVLARIIACEPDGAEDQPQHQISARFVAISEGCQDEIHRFILTTQRRERRGRLQAEEP